VCMCFCLFFFSSRRRHTRFSRDWSSDVCSSDLRDPVDGRDGGEALFDVADGYEGCGHVSLLMGRCGGLRRVERARAEVKVAGIRSEERRVGKEWRWRWAGGDEGKSTDGETTEME